MSFRRSLMLVSYTAMLSATTFMDANAQQAGDLFGAVLQGAARAAQAAQQREAFDNVYKSLQQDPVIEVNGQQLSCEGLATALEQFNAARTSFAGLALSEYEL